MTASAPAALRPFFIDAPLPRQNKTEEAAKDFPGGFRYPGSFSAPVHRYDTERVSQR